MIKEGDILVCKSLASTHNLTLDERYLVTKIDENVLYGFIHIKQIENSACQISCHIKFIDLFFIPLAELREQQIKTILDD